MADSSATAPGIREAATLLLSLGEEAAAQVIKLLSPGEVQRLSTVMAKVGSVSTQEISGTLNTFFEQVDAQSSIGADSEQYIRTALTAALGESKAAGLIDRII